MAKNTAIEWTDHTFNPWEGCQKVGPGCDHCYAETRNARYNGGKPVNWGPGAPRRRTSASNWAKPLKWNREAATFAQANGGRKQRVFCASLADVFDNAVDPQWRADLFDLIDKTPNLDWLLLTKRVGNVTGMLADMGREALPVHVWLGATIVNQAEADRDIPKLLAAPATIRFLSMEPLLGPVQLFGGSEDRKQIWNWLSGETGTMDFDGPDFDYGPKIDWIIVGGESGPGARPMHPDWARALRDQCKAAGVAFLLKQWGEWSPVGPIYSDEDTPEHLAACEVAAMDDGRDCILATDGGRWPECQPPEGSWVMHRIGKKQAGRHLDGALHTEFPA